jgi:hypothetical protein
MTLRTWRINKLLQIGNEIRELRHLNVTLNDVAGIQVAYGLDELFQGIVKLLLFIEVVGMFFRYLGYNFTWKVCSPSDILSL